MKDAKKSNEIGKKNEIEKKRNEKKISRSLSYLSLYNLMLHKKGICIIYISYTFVLTSINLYL